MAKRPEFEIGGERVAPGTHRLVHLPLSVLSDHTPAHLSVDVLHGKREGPCVFVSAAVHGDEVIGVEIVRRLLRTLDPAKLSGTLLVVPIVNGLGFLNRSRYLPDRRDLNRSFPGSPSGSLAARLAHLFLEEVVSRCTLGIDLHSAAIHRTNLPQIRISPGDPELMRLAHVFGAPVVMTSALREGSLRQVAKTRGVEVLLYEAGEGLRFDEMAVRAGVSGILRVLRDRGMVPARGIRPAKVRSVLCERSEWVRAPAGGLLRMYKAEGETVTTDEVIATVSDPFGASEVDILAPATGIIVGRAVLPVVNEGDALYHVGHIRKIAEAGERVEAIADQLAADPLFDEDEII